MLKKQIVSGFKQNLPHVGSALALLGIIFIAIKFFHNSAHIDFSHLTKIQWATLAVMVLIYGMANFLLSFAWWNILKHFGANIKLAWALNTYGIAQLAKYIPGNIFHFISRQALGLSKNLQGSMLIKSTLWELISMVISAAVFGFLLIPLVFFHLSLFSSFLIFITIFTVIFAIFYRWGSYKLTVAYILQFFFIVVSGILFVVTLVLISGMKPFSVCVTIFGSYIIAWLIGFLIPGAPAGVGIREMVLLFFLNGFLVKSDLLLSLVLGRLITISGDLLFFLICLLLKKKMSKNLISVSIYGVE